MAFKAAGINPQKTLIVSDTGATGGRDPAYVEKVPCMTATRLGRAEYWMSTRGRRMDVPEMFRYQGFKDTDNVDTACTRASELGDLLGNAASKNVIKVVLTKALVSAGLVEGELPRS